ncbi:MAG: calcium/sodium antiporter [Bacteroidota bacterium]
MFVTWLLIFVVALGVLIKASDWFVDAAEKIGLYLGVPAFIVGVTIVAAGTSLPELASSIVAVFDNSSEFVVGNVVGSNITNIFLVLAVAAMISRTIRISYNLMNIDTPMLVGSAFMLYFFLLDGTFHFGEALLCFLGLILFLTYTIRTGKNEDRVKGEKVTTRVYLRLAASVVLIYFGAEYTVLSVSKMSEILEIGKDVVALSLVAFGTSVPELMVTVVAARKGNPEIAVGNVLGSNIFNTFAVMGIPSFFGTLTITEEVSNFSLPLMMIATIMFMVVTMNKKVSFWEGCILLIFYLYYMVDLAYRNM